MFNTLTTDAVSVEEEKSLNGLHFDLCGRSTGKQEQKTVLVVREEDIPRLL